MQVNGRLCIECERTIDANLACRLRRTRREEDDAVRNRPLNPVARAIHVDTEDVQVRTAPAVQVNRVTATEVEHDLRQLLDGRADAHGLPAVDRDKPEVAV